MKQRNIILVLVAVVILGFIAYFLPKRTPSPAFITTVPACSKENNCCHQNSDCEFFWYTGGCQTPEYVAKVNKSNTEKGIMQGEAPRFDGEVKCTCESQKCVARDIHSCSINSGISTWCPAQRKCLISQAEKCK